MSEKIENTESVSFSVDAGIINRLGIELVGRSETAVSELIKNSYDADATEVEVIFKDTSSIGGNLIIDDNGEGMDLDGLKNGFMRLSSTDKVHNPISSKFKRKKAGKKGIGRFSTQRLGNKLTIITKKANMPQAIKLVIDWGNYKIDTNLNTIKNRVEYVKPHKDEGTIVIIEDLRDAWGSVEIRRVYRYITGLLQPDFLSERTSELNLAGEKSSNSFTVTCKRVSTDTDNSVETFETDSMLFDRAIASIEGYVDKNYNGYCAIESKKFELDGNEFIRVSSGSKKEEIEQFKELKNIHFKAYYYIYNRSEYYDFDNKFTSLELNSIQKLANEASGIKLYRNGFRVFPYGESGNDWLNIDRRLSKARTDNGINIPFGNNNLFGFVEIIDEKENQLFEETASREGLIENKAFKELQIFIYKSLNIAMNRIASAEKFIETKKARDKESGDKKGEEQQRQKEEPFESLKESLSSLQNKLNQNSPDRDELIESFIKELPEKIKISETNYNEKIKENGMLRVLAGIGLVIGEFVHEIEQFDTIFKSGIKFLKKKIRDNVILQKVDELDSAFLSYQSYTAYFRTSVSQNVKREIEPINLKMAANKFIRQIAKNSKKANIKVDTEFIDQYLFTCPMHPSEWLSILFNLYTNSKKAIRRSKTKNGSILIRIANIEGYIHFDFFDNGDGISKDIKEKIFVPFYTTSNPVNPDEIDLRDNSGTGLGLYIVQKIIQSYGGSIEVLDKFSEEGFNTCMSIKLPAND